MFSSISYIPKSLCIVSRRPGCYGQENGKNEVKKQRAFWLRFFGVDDVWMTFYVIVLSVRQVSSPTLLGGNLAQSVNMDKHSWGIRAF